MPRTQTPVDEEKARRIAEDQQAMARAREEAAREDERLQGRAELLELADEDVTGQGEEDSGQQVITGPGTEPRFSTDAGGAPPSEAELAIAAKRLEWIEDLRRGDDLLFLCHIKVGDVLIGAKKRFIAGIYDQVPFETDLGPREALQAVHDVRSKTQRHRAAIDQAAQEAQAILEDPAFEGISGIQLAAIMRERLYKRFSIDDDAHEVTYGIEEPDADIPQTTATAEPATVITPEPMEEGEKLDLRESELERRIEQAVAEGNTGLEEALRDELEEVRLMRDPELQWEDGAGE